MSIDLDDARQLLDRANSQIAEFRALFGRQSPAPVWSIHVRQEPTGAVVYSLRINRTTLREMKPPMADAANNLAHSLDHVAAACARLAKSRRSFDLFFPISDDDAKFAKAEKKVRPLVGDASMDLFARLRAQHRGPYHPSSYSYLALMRELSGGNKHWRLSVANSHANAVAWTLPGASQTVVGIPKGHFDTSDEFDFWTTDERANVPFEILLGLTLEGIAAFPNAGIDSAFGVAARLVEEVIVETERLFATARSRP